VFARQVFYHLSHTPTSYFALVILKIGSCAFCSELASLYNPTLRLSHSWDYRCVPLSSAGDRVLLYILGWPQTCDPLFMLQSLEY
jgi:hypothetical protein